MLSVERGEIFLARTIGDEDVKSNLQPQAWDFTNLTGKRDMVIRIELEFV